jgi:hypothetical protein
MGPGGSSIRLRIFLEGRMNLTEEVKIVGYKVGDETVCASCITPEEQEAIMSDNVITEDNVDLDQECVFCERCEEELR